ncbi:MAG TPA: ornithine carbamoyltransferase [Myxococcaceae bacterium]|nr:ornithine carbamoyltransferase [Myxococcaceae bacterium]
MTHFLTLADLPLAAHEKIFDRAVALKARRKRGERDTTLAGRTLVLIFEKASTRTRLSFEAAIGQLGGQAITLSTSDSQLSRGESWADTARVVSGYADAVMIRTFADARLQEFAKHSKVPVINGLTDGGHPVQLLTDLFTVRERLGSIEGRTVAWVGDGASNMARSWIEAAKIFGFDLRICAPSGYRPPPSDLHERVKLVEVPQQAVEGADVVTTDVWTSMGQEKESAQRRQDFAEYTVDSALMAQAKRLAIVLHCLPAHRGEEISSEVLDGPQSAAWDEAENRMHVQKALLEKLILAPAT